MKDHRNANTHKLHPPRMSHPHYGHTMTDGYPEAKVLHFIPEAGSLMEYVKTKIYNTF